LVVDLKFLTSDSDGGARASENVSPPIEVRDDWCLLDWDVQIFEQVGAIFQIEQHRRVTFHRPTFGLHKKRAQNPRMNRPLFC